MHLRRNTESIDRKECNTMLLADCKAKTVIDDYGNVKLGMDVETHCKIVGLVARELINLFPRAIQKMLFPLGTELVAAVHDVGKVNPIFQEKIRRSTTGYISNSCPCLRYVRPELEGTVGYHSEVSQAALFDVGPYIPEIAGRHHGKSSETIRLPDDEVLGGVPWQNLRVELIQRLKDFFGCDWPEIQDDSHAALLSGLTTVADWIGSGSNFNMLTDFSDYHSVNMIKKSLEQAGFVPPKIKRGLCFQEVFISYTPRPIQQALIDKVTKPGVYILEARMGQGKTEAALQAAYHLLETHQATGIYFALPTQLTSEKIYTRMNEFLFRILDPDDKHRSLLLHGNSWLIETDLGQEGRPGYDWFNYRKRRILSPFSVGTIDQALMAVMNVKHGFVRAFGLAGKVVILDEVHTYDAYTGTIMDYLIRSLSKLGCTVILLSATLTAQRKKEMLKVSHEGSDVRLSDEYPLISGLVNGKRCEQVIPEISEERIFEIMYAGTDDEVLDIIRNKALQGQYILWIENTVRESQDIYKKFAVWGSENGIEVGLLHSRFPQIVRESKEGYWVDTYGKPGKEYRKGNGKILIGTQVLEQSLDIDADFLVTHLAPTDMLLQRIGRLWRHKELNDYRPTEAKRQVLIISPLFEEVMKNPNWVFGVSGKVYSPYVLFRTLEVWSKRNYINIPGDMRDLIEQTYEDRLETGNIAKVKYELSQQKETLRRFAFNGMATAGKTLSDNTPTRYSEVPTCDVLLLRKGTSIEDGLLNLIDGVKILLPVKSEPLEMGRRKKLSRELIRRFISVPCYLAPNPVNKRELAWLKPYCYISRVDEERLRVAYLDPSDQIRGLGNRIVNDYYRLSYSEVLGYTAKKKKEDA